MIDPAEVQLVLLPPIGSDERAYYPQRSLPFKVIALQHIAWRDNESLTQHAKRYYAHLLATHKFDPTKPIVWAGMSLGGALAQEFSVLHPPLGMILMSSFRSYRDLPPVVRGVGRIAHRIPTIVYKLAGDLAPLIMKGIGYMSAKDIDMMIAVYRKTSKRSFRNAFKALSEWTGIDHAPRVPTLRIHGKDDPLIPLKRIEGVDVILDTMHLVTLAKPVEVNRSVTDFIIRLTADKG
jgi:pimeloyl-ACP methyl ester carboxylesterase